MALSNFSWSDQRSIVLLLILYTLQGIPMGLSGSIPIILRENGVTYENISIFSLVSLPFSLKLLWAPLVDSLYIPSLGRRKSWLLPIQTISGFILLYGSYHIKTWIEINHNNSHTNIYQLTSYFLLLYFMMATQDIAVDGWALTLLTKENIAYGTVCNAIGQTFGFILANQGFLIFSDPNWCRDMFGLSSPLLDLSSFMFFWGIFFLLITLGLLLFVTESPHSASLSLLSSSSSLSLSLPSPSSNSSSTTITPSPSSNNLSITKSYAAIYEICQLHSIQKLMLILFTSKLSMAPCDAVSIFKLQEYGMPRSDIAILSPLLLIVSFSLPVCLGSILAKRPLEILWKGLFLKLCSSTCIWILFEMLSSSSSSSSSAHSSSAYPPFPSYYLIFSLVMIFNEFSSNLIFNSQMSFFSKIADPTIGGTYMTLLNTVANLGSKWPNFVSLYFLPVFSTSYCKYDNTIIEYQIRNAVDTTTSQPRWRWLIFYHCDTNFCHELNGTCEILYDGYTLQQHLATCVGILWLLYFIRILSDLENTHPCDWVTPKISSHPMDISSNKEV